MTDKSMKKPEKKDLSKSLRGDYHSDDAHNQCWDDREKWLRETMSEEEIFKIITSYFVDTVRGHGILTDLAKAISARIRGEG